MLKLEHVNKYFNKNKKNEIHVINETSLHMEGKGLVALLGPSGCGKTTLLNVIGGLDKVNSGQIFVNGQRITGRLSHTVDKIRNLNVGYVFQNPFSQMSGVKNTVFEEIAMGLENLGVEPKEMLNKDAIIFSFYRLLLIPFLVGLLLWKLPLDELSIKVSVLLTAMPAASTSVMLAQKYHRDYKFASELIMTSTILSLITIPLVAAALNTVPM